MAYEKISYNAEFNAKHYDVIRATVPKGKRKLLQEYAQKQGESVSQLIVKALEQCYGIDLSK